MFSVVENKYALAKLGLLLIIRER